MYLCVCLCHSKRVGVFCCGPKGISRTLHRLCNSARFTGVTFEFNKESFSWDGGYITSYRLPVTSPLIGHQLHHPLLVYWTHPGHLYVPGMSMTWWCIAYSTVFHLKFQDIKEKLPLWLGYSPASPCFRLFDPRQCLHNLLVWPLALTHPKPSVYHIPSIPSPLQLALNESYFYYSYSDYFLQMWRMQYDTLLVRMIISA